MKGGTLSNKALYTPFIAQRSQQWGTATIFSLHKTVTLFWVFVQFSNAARNGKSLVSEQMFAGRTKTVFIKFLSAMLHPNFKQAAALSHLLVHKQFLPKWEEMRIQLKLSF